MVNKSQELIEFLESKGFSRVDDRLNVILVRNHEDDERLRVVISTPIPLDLSVPPNGKVWISTFFYAAKIYTIFNGPTVFFNDDDLINKVLHTARQAYVRGSEWLLQRLDKNVPKENESKSGFLKISCPPTPLDRILSKND